MLNPCFFPQILTVTGDSANICGRQGLEGCKGEEKDLRDKCKEKKIEALLQQVIVNCFYFYFPL